MTKPVITIEYKGRPTEFEVGHWSDISLHISGNEQPNAFGLPLARFDPFVAGQFVGSVELGGPVRCDVVTVAPHGNGTHTECVGHLAGNRYLITDCMSDQLDVARLITVLPELDGSDLLVTAKSLEAAWIERDTTTLIIRTLPNNDDKKLRKWSGNNPPYFHPDAMALIVASEIRHLMVDIPSVDREEDQGALVCHHLFWHWPAAPRVEHTITELIYVHNDIPDGVYAVLFNVAPFDGDAAPSRPVLLEMRQ